MSAPTVRPKPKNDEPSRGEGGVEPTRSLPREVTRPQERVATSNGLLPGEIASALALAKAGQFKNRPAEEVYQLAEAAARGLRDGSLDPQLGAPALLSLASGYKWDARSLQDIYFTAGEKAYTEDRDGTAFRLSAAKTGPVAQGFVEGVLTESVSPETGSRIQKAMERLAWASSYANKADEPTRCDARERLRAVAELVRNSPIGAQVAIPSPGELPPVKRGEPLKIEMLAAHFAKNFEGTSREEFLAQLSQIPRVHGYSWNNQLLMALQMSEVSLVAGPKAWEEKFNRRVKEGAEPLAIVGYSVGTRTRTVEVQAEEVDTDSNPAPVSDEDAPQPQTVVEVKRSFVTFPTVKVFDISQTEQVEGKPVLDLHGDKLMNSYIGGELHEKALEAAAAAMRAEGLKLEYKKALSLQQQFHWGTSKGGYVEVLAGMPAEKTFATTVHEWAHEIIHQTFISDREGQEPNPEPTRIRKDGRNRGRVVSPAQAELEADLTAYLVGDRFGIDTSKTAAIHLKGYGIREGDLAEAWAVAIRASDRIIAKMRPFLEEKRETASTPAEPVVATPEGARARARAILSGDFLALRVETTGSGSAAQAVGFSVVDPEGKTVYDARVRPAIVADGRVRDEIEGYDPYSDHAENLRRVLEGQRVVTFGVESTRATLRTTADSYLLADPSAHAEFIDLGALVKPVIGQDAALASACRVLGVESVGHGPLGEAKALVGLLRAVGSAEVTPQEAFDGALKRGIEQRDARFAINRAMAAAAQKVGFKFSSVRPDDAAGYADAIYYATSSALNGIGFEADRGRNVGLAEAAKALLSWAGRQAGKVDIAQAEATVRDIARVGNQKIEQRSNGLGTALENWRHLEKASAARIQQIDDCLGLASALGVDKESVDKVRVAWAKIRPALWDALDVENIKVESAISRLHTMTASEWLAGAKPVNSLRVSGGLVENAADPGGPFIRSHEHDAILIKEALSLEDATRLSSRPQSLITLSDTACRHAIRDAQVNAIRATAIAVTPGTEDQRPPEMVWLQAQPVEHGDPQGDLVPLTADQWRLMKHTGFDSVALSGETAVFSRGSEGVVGICRLSGARRNRHTTPLGVQITPEQLRAAVART